MVVAGFGHKMSLHYGQPHEWMECGSLRYLIRFGLQYMDVTHLH